LWHRTQTKTSIAGFSPAPARSLAETIVVGESNTINPSLAIKFTLNATIAIKSRGPHPSAINFEG
jgi:hypothetical protein